VFSVGALFVYAKLKVTFPVPEVMVVTFSPSTVAVLPERPAPIERE
jgi:hypothetical protein